MKRVYLWPLLLEIWKTWSNRFLGIGWFQLRDGLAGERCLFHTLVRRKCNEVFFFLNVTQHR